ncbi:MAG: Gfo/Idh/MocA family protein [Vicinamibacterales bacterium]
MREILIAGLGSIGRRHLANLRSLGWQRIRGYRTGLSTLPDLGLEAADVDTDLAAALRRRPLAVIVSNPSACHVRVALEAARAGAHLLIEKPLSHDVGGVDELERVIDSSRLTALVGFQFRFHPGLRQLRDWITTGALGAVVSAHAHWGEYLPDMHPWEDYRTGYAARPELGGGVLLTLCHPFDYLAWLIGDIARVAAVASDRDTLGLQVETSVDAVLQFRCGAAGHVHLDFVQRPPDHHIRVIGTEGTATWTQSDQTARLYAGSPGRQTTTTEPAGGFERNTMFLEEMRHFLACLRGEEEPSCTVRDGRRALEAVLAVKQSITQAGAQVYV